MTIKKTIEKEFEKFFEFPDGGDKSVVTVTSCKLFAEHIAKIAYAKGSNDCRNIEEEWVEWVDHIRYYFIRDGVLWFHDDGKEEQIEYTHEFDDK